MGLGKQKNACGPTKQALAFDCTPFVPNHTCHHVTGLLLGGRVAQKVYDIVVHVCPRRVVQTPCAPAVAPFSSLRGALVTRGMGTPRHFQGFKGGAPLWRESLSVSESESASRHSGVHPRKMGLGGTMLQDRRRSFIGPRVAGRRSLYKCFSDKHFHG